MTDEKARDVAYHAWAKNIPFDRIAGARAAFDAGWKAHADLARTQREVREVVAKLPGPKLRLDESADPDQCDIMGCKRKAVVSVPVFGIPGGPGCSANVCRKCAKTERVGEDTNLTDHARVSSHTRRFVAKVAEKFSRAPTARTMAMLGRDVVRCHKGAGPKVMAELDYIVENAGLRWGVRWDA